MSGVVAGSAAAGIQSAVYGGATAGVFSVFQSVGAALAWVPVPPVARQILAPMLECRGWTKSSMAVLSQTSTRGF